MDDININEDEQPSRPLLLQSQLPTLPLLPVWPGPYLDTSDDDYALWH